MKTIKDLARLLTPPLLWRGLAKVAHRRQKPEPCPEPPRWGWFGDYSSWAEVKALATGYDAGEILSKVENAALKAKRGECVFERDATCHYKQSYNWPLLASLFYCASQTDGHLRLLDFGGALGSVYMQYRAEWRALRSVEWSVVEQFHYVQSGKQHFENATLRFYETPDEALKMRPADILLLSSVIAYIEKPYDLLQGLLSRKFRWILIDRTGFSLEGRDRLTLQKVPPSIYDASYPCWFLDRMGIQSALKGYSLIWDFLALDEDCKWPRPPSRFMGMLLESIENAHS